MQQIVAVLSPTIVDSTPEQQDRAQRALFEQMMLLARGLDVTSPQVRCAAEMVGSALAPSPDEFELKPGAAAELPNSMDIRSARSLSPANYASASSLSEPASESRWQQDARFSRYLKTIMSTQPE